MESIGKLFNVIMQGMKMEFIVYGHIVSWWQVYVFVIVVAIIGIIIGGVFSD